MVVGVGLIVGFDVFLAREVPFWNCWIHTFKGFCRFEGLFGYALLSSRGFDPWSEV